MTGGFRYQCVPFLERREEERPLLDCGICGISGTDEKPAGPGSIPEKPEIPESGVGLTILSSPLEDGADLERIASANLNDVIERLKQLLRFSDDLDYVAVIIAVALTYILDLLPGTVEDILSRIQRNQGIREVDCDFYLLPNSPPRGQARGSDLRCIGGCMQTEVGSMSR